MEQQQEMIDRYGVALLMIREGAEGHREIASKALRTQSPGSGT
jgi:hypothetical protein